MMSKHNANCIGFSGGRLRIQSIYTRYIAQPRTAELAALEHKKKSHILIMGEMLFALYLLHFLLDLHNFCR